MQNGEIKIEKGIPVPETRGVLAKYPFSSMEVGDSFFVAASDTGDLSHVRSAASWNAKRHEMKFCTRTVDGGVRVWRLE